MLFLNWIKSQEGRLVCTWDVPATPVSNFACCDAKSLSLTVTAGVEGDISPEEAPHRNYLALAWVNPRQRKKWHACNDDNCCHTYVKRSIQHL